MLKKICSRCGIKKPLEKFRNSLEGKLGKTSYCKDCLSVLGKEYRKKNQEVLKKKRKEKYYRDVEENKRKKREWYKNNKERSLKNTRAWDNKKRNSDPIYKLKCNIRSGFYKFMKGTKQKSTWEYFNYNLETLKEHLELQFKDGMSWENYGKWHVDHIIPQSSFDFTKDEEVNKCWLLDNLQPLWAINNLKKSNKIL